MIMTSLKVWLGTIRTLVTNLRALLVFIALYAVLLVSFYLFVSTREATVWQVLVTYLFLNLVPAEFFVLQASIIDSARDLKLAWKRTVRSALKIFMVTIPVLIIGWVLWLLINKLQGRFPAPVPPIVFETGPPKSQPTHWPTLLLSTLRLLLFGVLLPLTAIHLWIEASACDIRASFAGGPKRIFGTLGKAMTRAFSSDSVFIYGLGLILFALIPYAILSLKINIKGTKTAFAIFITQIALAFLFVLFGWVVTIATLVRNANRAPEARQSVAPGVSPGNTASPEVLSPL